MPSEFTPRYNLAKPNVNGLETENVWGYDINLNFDKLDAAIIKPAELSEAIEDQTASLLRPGANISLSYNDSAGTLTITGLIGTEQIDDRVAALLKAGPYIGVSYNDAAGTLTISNLFGPEGVHDAIYDSIRAGNNVAIAYDEVGNRITIHSLGPGGSTGPQNVFDTIHDARLAEIPAQLKTITLSGYDRPGDGGPAMPCRRTPGPVTRHQGWFRTADRFKEDGFEDPVNGGYWEYVGNNGPIWLEWFGGAADYYDTPQDGSGISTVNPTPVNNHAAIMAACEFLYAHIDFVHTFAGVTYTTFDAGPTIQLGYGTYFTDTLKLTTSITLQGMGAAGWHDTAQSRLMFPAGQKGIIVTCPALTGSGEATVVHEKGVVNLRNVFIACQGHGGQTTQHGIEMNTTCNIEHCYIGNFGGHGIDITADIFSVPTTNSNLFYINRTAIVNNAGDGIYCQGGDANAGIGIALNLMTNGGWGINDQSFLGNTWIGCHTAGNGNWSTGVGGPYRAPGGGNSRTLFLGCYSESDQAPSQVGVPALFIGGIHAAGANVEGFSIIDAQLWPHTLMCATSAQSASKLGIQVRSGPNNIHTYIVNNGGYATRWGYEAADGVFAWRYGDVFEYKYLAYAISSEENIATWGRPEPVPVANIAFPKGIFLGDGVNVRKFGYVNKYGSNFSVGMGYERPPGAYLAGDINWFIDAGTPFQPNAVGEYCFTAGVYTLEVWASGSTYSTHVLKNLGTQYYSCVLQGPGPSTVQPVHTSGINAPGADGYRWRWIGNTAAVWRQFGEFIGATTAREDDDELRETINALQARVAQLEAANGH